MAGDLLTPIFTFVGWAFVPGWVTSVLQSIYYRISVPVGQASPQRGTFQFAKDHRRIRILVLTLYLLYTVAQSLYDIKLAGDFFTLLAVSPESSDREIKSRFRRLAAKYHPDKIQPTAVTSDGDTSTPDAHFMVLKVAQDTLLNPTLRFAYVRFGPSIVHTALSQSLKPSIRTYVYSGLRHNLLPSYFINIAYLTGLNYFILTRWGKYWRYYALTLIFTIELYFLTHSDPSFTNLLPGVLSSTLSNPIKATYGFLQARTRLQSLLPPHLLPYQTLSILRQLSISLNIFISQLAPPNQAAALTAANAKSQIATLLNSINQSLTHLSTTAGRADQETTSLLSFQLSPFSHHTTQAERLREGMKEGVVRGALMANPEVRAAIETVSRRKRTSNVASSIVDSD